MIDAAVLAFLPAVHPLDVLPEKGLVAGLEDVVGRGLPACGPHRHPTVFSGFGMPEPDCREDVLAGFARGQCPGLNSKVGDLGEEHTKIDLDGSVVVDYVCHDALLFPASWTVVGQARDNINEAY